MKRILLLLGMLSVSNISFGQLTENFEGGVFPPAGWTKTTTSPAAYQWKTVTGASALQGNTSASVEYNPALVPAQNEGLISPEFTLAAGSPVLTFEMAMSYYWGVSPNDNYDFVVSISTNGGTSYTDIWDEEDLGVFDNYVAVPVAIPLTAYAGQSVKLKFSYIGSDGAQLILDNIAIKSCVEPTGFTYVDPQPTPTAVNIGWDLVGSPVGYEFEYGPAGFMQEFGTMLYPTTNSVSLSGLSPETNYDFYVRTNCGNGDFSDWAGPIPFSTLPLPATIPYAYGFEGDHAGWTLFNAGTGNNWNIYTASTSDPISVAPEGTKYAGYNYNTTNNANAWLFSRDIAMTQGTTYKITFEYRVAGGTTVYTENLKVTIGDDNTVAAQTTTLFSQENIGIQTWTEAESFFTPSTTGTYNLGFNCFSLMDKYRLGIDNINITAVPLSVGEFDSSAFNVFPNPVNDIITVDVNSSALMNKIDIADLNGRIVKSVNLNALSNTQINLSELSAGVYLMTVSSNEGTATKKIIKK